MAVNQYKESADKNLEGALGNPNGTQGPSGEKGPNENLYNEVNAKSEPYQPNKEGLANTGSGVEAALGTDYSWNKQGTQKAETQFQADVLAQKQNALTNRQTIENNSKNYQAQADMMKYQNNQNAEKVGWTGGYVLDQNRQSEYLKASIQAQMYGAMELQKYGYDSSLAAARLSYDLNQQEYARQYYQEAVTAALSEAQLTGTYFSAETKDMMSQLAVAEQKLKDNPEDETAAKLKDTIYNWFSSNGISQAGVKTLEAWQAEQNQNLQWSQELYTRYNAAVQALKADKEMNPNTFFKLDENGNPIFDGVDVQTIDFAATSIGDALDYVIQDGEIASSGAKQQIYAYFNWLINDAIAMYKESVMTKDSNGNTSYNINKQTLAAEIKKATEKVMQYIDDEKADHLLDDYSFSYNDTNVNIDWKPGEEPGGGIKEPETPEGYNHKGTWTNAEAINVTTDKGTESVSLSNLAYMDWNDPNNYIQDSVKKNFSKASMGLDSGKFPESWLSTIKSQLNPTNTLLEVLPTILSTNPSGSNVTYKVNGLQNFKYYDTLEVQDGNYGLGGQIEYFLKDFYEQTTGTKIQVGSMIAIGDRILVWAGDDGKGYKSGRDARWAFVNKYSPHELIQTLVDL